MTWSVGGARISRIEEQAIDVPIAIISDDPALFGRGIAAWPTDMLDPDRGTFRLVTQSWIVQVDGLIVVIDPCNGNGRVRSGFPHFERLDVPWLERFAHVGIDPGAVDIVLCTHLHCDHCGWNTRREGGRWVPTFPNARYLFVRRELERWDPARSDRPADPDYNRTVFEESVRPILEAGQAEPIDTPFAVSNSLSIEAAEGHTRGHAIMRLESGGTVVYFTGDVVHHPMQILRPALYMPGCDDLTRAIATRERLLARIRDERAWIVPAHFGAPHHGRVMADDTGGFTFLPGGLDAVARPRAKTDGISAGSTFAVPGTSSDPCSDRAIIDVGTIEGDPFTGDRSGEGSD